nr:MAG TPA: hypothetical protein [Caudoviricetes sp.]
MDDPSGGRGTRNGEGGIRRPTALAATAVRRRRQVVHEPERSAVRRVGRRRTADIAR